MRFQDTYKIGSKVSRMHWQLLNTLQMMFFTNLLHILFFNDGLSMVHDIFVCGKNSSGVAWFPCSSTYVVFTGICCFHSKLFRWIEWSSCYFRLVDTLFSAGWAIFLGIWKFLPKVHRDLSQDCVASHTQLVQMNRLFTLTSNVGKVYDNSKWAIVHLSPLWWCMLTYDSLLSWKLMHSVLDLKYLAA